MARIPQYRQQRLPTTNVGAAPLPLAAADTGAEAIGAGISALGSGVASFGESMFKIQQMNNQSKDLIAESKLKNSLQEAELEYQTLTENDGDTKNWPKYREQVARKLDAQRNSLTWGNSRSKQIADVMVSGWNGVFIKESELGIVKKNVKDAITVTEVQLVNSLSSLDPNQAMMSERNEQAYREALKTTYSPEITELFVNKAKQEGTANNIYSQSILAENKEEGYKVIDNSNLPDDVKTKLGNKLDEYWAGRKNASKQNIIQTYEQFADKLVKGNFNGDDIALSNLDKTEEKLWSKVLEGKRKESPIETSFDGSQNMLKTVTDFSKETIGKKEAIWNATKARYIDQSITDSQYKYMISRINKPYPRYFSEVLSGVNESAKEFLYHRGVGFLGNDWLDSTEKEHLVKINDATISWIESQDKLPSTEELYKEVRKFGITIDTPKKTTVSAEPRPIPAKADPLYVIGDEAYNAIPSGTIFYSGDIKEWMIKP